ncbi:MAG TPA: hypothetical protein VFM33_13195 [Aquabacterium sp.]|nr:hypothetical protein [Aquabacterium sp.]
MKKLLTLLAFALLGGCATQPYNPIPENYAGPTAVIEDSFNGVSGSEVEFFYVDKLDGHDIRNARLASISASAGHGMSMSVVPVERAIPASKPVSLLIVGRTQYAAPILAMTNSVYQIKGTVDFTPEPNKHYVVKGSLAESRSSVWLEDAQTKKVIGNKIEFEGSTALGLFDK